MGIFDDIIKPVTDLINGLEKPIHVVESIFGTVIDMVEETIADIRSMIEDMRNLFNAANVESLFITPFRDAALTAVKDVDTLYKLISSVSSPVIDGVESDIMNTINTAYNTLRNGLKVMLTAMAAIMNRISQDLQNATHVIHGDFQRLKSLIESFPAEIAILSRKIGQELLVVGDDAFDILPEVKDIAISAGNSAFSAVRKAGTVVAADFTSLETSLKKRIDNENAAYDLLIIVIVMSIIALLVGVYMLTHSITLIIIVIIIIIISLLIYTIIDLVIG